ncbi:hypothetical protein CIK99_09765 [Prevotella sp. P5-92]|uniref:BspA family leucine-rich repeat surface protein n=1 Tax=Prevotella sp. P5-92 TaxID=2024222 RepID=UPI000B962C81|nr:BspA family leucine-rich repeat surface protein [Prevotella sp. P5-92]OYP56247.1 hypothetical protein CIK99_09765 [Prevotella sp. P5-92]
MTSKRKTKQLRWLVTMMMLAMTMVMPASTWAQVMYTVFEGGTLTFKYGDKPESGNVYDVPTDPTHTNISPDWLANTTSITTVVFDPSFQDARPTSCYKWFYNCSKLTSIKNIENLNTANVTNMRYMFYDCQSLESLILSSFNTANVTTMSNMFDGCKKLTSLKLSNFNTANVTDMGSMFRDCSSLTSLELSSFNTANVTDMGFMFYECSGLTSLDLSNFDTSNVTNMLSMFSSCSGLSSLDLSNFDTSNVKNMTRMFNGCSSLTSLDLPSFKTANVTYMSYMFNGCSRLTSLDLSNFNTSNVTNMSYMFYNCSRLTSLDLSNFNTAKVTKMDYMFKYCSGLKTIYVSDDFTTSDGTSGLDMFKGCSKLEGAASYSDLGKTGKSMANYKTGYFTKSNLTPYVKWDENTKVLTFKVANYIEGTQGEWKFNEGATAPGWLGEVYSDCEKVVFTPSFNHAKPTSCCQWFLGFSQLTTIEGIENLNTEEVTDMSEMFNSCSGLKSLDLSKFNTANVTNMEGMFGGLGLISLDLSSFNTANVKDMTYMFYNCQDLTTIYVSDDFTIGNVSSSDGMFQSCFGLEGAASYYPLYTGIEMANYKDGYFKTYFTLGENKVELCGNPLTTKSLNLSGDYDFTPKYEFKAKSATYSRDLSSSNSTWFSLCLPFAYTPANFNFTAYQLNGATANAVEIEEITGEIAAGTPVLFKFKDGEIKEINISATDAQIVKAPVDGAKVNGTDGSSLQLCGTYQTKTFSKDADGNAFILLNNKLMNPAKMLENQNVTKVSVKPFRAYMTLTASAQTSSARAFSIGRGGEEGTTAIDLLNSVATDDAEYYDINGRRIDAPAKGVNIVRRGNKTIKLIIK